MDNYFGRQLLQMNYQTDKYGSPGWIKNVNKLNDDSKYKLYATNESSIGGGRDYIALPTNTKLTWQMKQKYNLH